MKNREAYLHYQQARSMTADGHLQPAGRAIRAARAIEDNPTFRLVEGKLLAQAGKYSEAIEILETVPESSPEWAQAQSAIKKARDLEGAFLKRWLLYPVARFALILLLILITISGLLLLQREMIRRATESELRAAITPLDEQTHALHNQLQALGQRLANDRTAANDRMQATLDTLQNQTGQRLSRLESALQQLSRENTDQNRRFDLMHQRLMALQKASSAAVLENPGDTAAMRLRIHELLELLQAWNGREN